jgi:putative ABC transport system permease protein
MQDLRDAIRALRAAPIVAAVAILSLALGIGANTAIFSIVNSLLLRSLPVHEPERLVMLNTPKESAASWTYPMWEEVRRRQTLVDGAAAYSIPRFNVSRSGQTDFVEGLYVNGEFFAVLGVPAMLGRVLAQADDRRGGGPDGPVAVISYSYWQRRFGGAATAIGSPITLERVPFTIVGVTPPSFFGPVIGRGFDVAVPFGTEPLLRARSALDERGFWWVEIMLRLKAGQTLESATTAWRGVQPQIREATMPPRGRPQDLAAYLKEPFTLTRASAGAPFARTRFGTPVLALMGVVALVLLIACANIANLMLARSSARRREIAIRAALGASRWRLARLLFVESVVLSALGGALGLLFARWAGQLLVQQMSTATRRLVLDLTIDWRLLGFTMGAAMMTAILFGTVPAFRATRVKANDALKDQARGLAGEGRLGFANFLVVTQIALSLILVVAAGLFVGTFARLATLDLGFDSDRVLVAQVNAQRSRTKPDLESRTGLYERLRLAAMAVPGVATASASEVTPVAGMTIVYRVRVPGAPDMPERERTVLMNVVSPDFFRTFGTRLLAGRDIDVNDTRTSEPVAIVNEAFARKFMNGANPTGRTVEQEGSPARPAVLRRVVGYVEDAVYADPRRPLSPTTYVPLTQITESPFLTGATQISVRAEQGSPALLTRGVAHALTSVDPDVALTFRPLADQIRSSLAQERVVAMLAGFFGGLALLLAALGLYGVTAYSVGRRKAEIGIRMALGAEPRAVLRMVLGRVAVLIFAGVMVGTVASLWAARFVSTLLFGLEPRDPATLAVAAAVLVAIGGVAGWLPARRAARIDPAQVLRDA